MPELRAFNPVSTALDRTKKLLFEPFDAWVWLKLIIIMFFVGSGGRSFNPGNIFRYTTGNTDGYTNEYLTETITSLLSEPAFIAALVLIVIALIAIALFFSYLRGVFSFVLIDALTSGEVHIIKPFKENMGRGFKVFLFNVLMTLVTLAIVLVLLVAMLLTIFWIVDISEGVRPAGMILPAVFILLIALLAFLIISVILGLFIGFFYDFAVPLMRFKNMGLLQSIKHVFGLVKKEPVEFLVYVILRWALEAAVGLIFGLIYLIVFAVFLAFGIIVVMMGAAAAQLSTWLWIPFILLIILGIAIMVIIMAVITMPIGVYFRYFSLDFLRSFDPTYVEYKGRFAVPQNP